MPYNWIRIVREGNGSLERAEVSHSEERCEHTSRALIVCKVSAPVE